MYFYRKITLFCICLVFSACSSYICPAYQSVTVFEKGNNSIKYDKYTYSVFGKKLKKKKTKKIIHGSQKPLYQRSL